MKKVISFILLLSLCFSLAGCKENEEEMNEHVAELKSEISILENELSVLEDEIVQLERERETLQEEIKELDGSAKYIVTFNIKQSHFSFDLTEHLKDAFNDISIQIPVDKEYYDSIEIGDTIDDSFRMGSLVFKGSFGSWEITVEDKQVC